MMKKLLYIGNKLSKHGSTTTVIETLGISLSKEGYTLTYASDKKNQIHRMIDMIFTTILNASKVDYVLLDTYSTSSFYYTLLVSQLCRLFHVKYIPILHGGNLPSRILSSPFLSQLIFMNSYKNVAPSNYLYEAFLLQGYSNLIYIPNTIEIENYPFLHRKHNEPKILWVRSFSSIYNPKMAIRVFSEVRKEFPKAELCMVGPDKENMINDCKLYAKSLGVEVLFTGKLSKEKWIDLSKNYNVFINTTHFDNTPVSVIEAMALGLPVVSTNVGGIPFFLKDKENALLVEDNNSEKMTEAIKNIFHDQNLRNTIVVNAQKMVATFDWHLVKHKWFEILK